MSDAEADTASARRRGLLYGRRKGPKLSAHQLSLRETLLPSLRFDGALPDGMLWLEIGFGAGEHLVWQAQRNPDVSLIGAEPYEGGTAKLLAKLVEQPLPNIRIHEGDARDVLARVPDGRLGRVFLLFPDPWPKTRHHKRRFVQMEMLDELARAMAPGAEFRFASDDAGYLAWTLERLMAHRAFEWTAERARDWTARTPDWPQTRYEAKALHGPPVFLRFVRTARL